jgi:hypothetical protein
MPQMRHAIACGGSFLQEVWLAGLVRRVVRLQIPEFPIVYYQRSVRERYDQRRARDRAEPRRDLILVACGLFQAYVAAFDSSVFNLMTSGDLSSRLVVSLATISAAGVPFFFALGALKEGIIPGWETVFFYERLLRGSGFWTVSALFTLSLIPIAFLQGRLCCAEGLLLTGLALGVAAYLFLIAKRRIELTRAAFSR